MFNVVVGIIWQVSLVIFPMALVSKEYPSLVFVCLSILITSLILKFTWWNKLDESSKETLPTDFDERVLKQVPTSAPVSPSVAE